MDFIKYIYDKYLITFQRRALNKELPQIISDHSRGKLLDIGSLNQPYKKYANYTKYEILDIEDNKEVDYCEDIHTTSLKDEQFDTIILTEVLEHLYDPKLALKQIHRIMKPKAYLVGSVPVFYSIHGNEHYDYYRYTYFGLIELLKEFEDIHIIPLGNRFTVIMDLLATKNIIFRILIQIFKIIPFKNNRFSRAPSGYIFYCLKK